MAARPAMTDQTPNLPIPPGTRDVLPDEMRELRRVESSLRDTFDRFGYAEVATPAIEYDDVILSIGSEVLQVLDIASHIQSLSLGPLHELSDP